MKPSVEATIRELRTRGDLKIVRTLGVATSVVAKGRLGDLMAMLNNLLRTESVGMPPCWACESACVAGYVTASAVPFRESSIRLADRQGHVKSCAAGTSFGPQVSIVTFNYTATYC